MQVLHINVNYIVSLLHQTMIEHLNQLGVVNKVFVPTYDKKISIVPCNSYVTVSECFKKWDRFFYFFKQRKIINTVQKEYDIARFDIIHAYTLFTDGNVAMNMAKKYGLPYVVAVRNTDLNVFLKYMFHLRSLGVEILNNASAVFFLSPAYRDAVLTQYVPSDLRDSILRKSYVIPNGIDDYWLENRFVRDASALQGKTNKNNNLHFIYVGGIDKNKNIETTLKALNKLEKEGWNCTLTAIGKIVDKKVFDVLSQYKCFNYVQPQKKEQLIAFYRNADIFIMPSYTETFGLVYSEALSQGLPVIYSRGQGFDRQFPEGKVGFSVNSSSEDEIVQKIKYILEDYSSISIAASEGAKKFNWSNIVSNYKDIYESVIANF